MMLRKYDTARNFDNKRKRSSPGIIIRVDYGEKSTQAKKDSSLSPRQCLWSNHYFVVPSPSFAILLAAVAVAAAVMAVAVVGCDFLVGLAFQAARGRMVIVVEVGRHMAHAWEAAFLVCAWGRRRLVLWALAWVEHCSLGARMMDLFLFSLAEVDSGCCRAYPQLLSHLYIAVDQGRSGLRTS